MATHRLPIFGFPTVPDDTGTAFFQPYSVEATNDVWKHLVLTLNDTAADHGIYGKFAVPVNYVDTANLVIVWTSTAVAGVVAWDFMYRAVGGNDTESLDQAGSDDDVNVDDTAPGAVNRRLEVSIALTDGDFAAEDTVEYFFSRDGTDGDDTMAAAALVFGLFFEYNDA